MTKRKMTQRQKIKYFQSDEGGGAAIDKVNEFISSPKALKQYVYCMKRSNDPSADISLSRKVDRFQHIWDYPPIIMFYFTLV
jgi:hypothetical protein